MTVQIGLAGCLIAYVVKYESLDDNPNRLYLNPFLQPADQWYLPLFVTKFLMTTVMHLNIFPNFQNSMNVMKYVNNHPSRFDYHNLAFWLAAVQCMSSFVYEILNVVILFT